MKASEYAKEIVCNIGIKHAKVAVNMAIKYADSRMIKFLENTRKEISKL